MKSQLPNLTSNFETYKNVGFQVVIWNQNFEVLILFAWVDFYTCWRRSRRKVCARTFDQALTFLPSGSSACLKMPEGHSEARSAEFDGVGWDGMGWDGLTKVSFNFLHTLWVYRLCLYLLIQLLKIVINILMGFKIWCQVGGGDKNFKFTAERRRFFFLI